MTRDLTKGPLLPALITFTVPLVLGNLLQLTYNAVDSIIVGRFLGKGALAAVGTGNPMMTLVLLFINGICLGAGVLIGHFYGAGQRDALQRQISTGMISGVIFSVAVTALMLPAARPILRLLQVDAAIMDMATAYLRIIMLGLLFSFVYNYLAAALRAMGDSRSPLYFLALSAVLNIAGDLFFIIVMKMGVTGAALSTVLCEGVSAALCWLYVYRRIPELRLGRGWLVFDRSLLGKTLSYGIVSALQQAGVQIGILCTQGMVNSLGITPAAAFSACNRFDDYAIVPERNIANAMTSVMAQNDGAGEKRRVWTAFRLGLVLETVFSVAMGLVLYIFSNPLMQLFTSDAQVIYEGEQYLHRIALMYVLPGITNGLQGFFRGIGDMKITLWSTLVNMTTRVVSLIPMIYVLHLGLKAVPWSYCFGWILMFLFEMPFVLRHRKKYLVL